MLTASYETKDSTHARAMCEREAKPLPPSVRQRINRLAHALGEVAEQQQHQRLSALAKVQQQQGSTAEQLLNLITSVAGIRH